MLILRSDLEQDSVVKGKEIVIRVEKIVILLLLCLFSFSSVSANQTVVADSEVEENIHKVQLYLSMDKETLPYEEVVALSSSIIQNRKLYTGNIVAKVYVLLADAATNKGDVARAFQFARDGLSLTSIDRSIRLNLLLKVAAGYYVKGKFHQVHSVAEQVIDLSEQQIDIQYRLIALSYRAVAFALMAQHEKALTDLQTVENLILKYQQFADHIELLEILAIAHYYLGDYHTAITIHQKLLKLRSGLSRTDNIENTYYNLAGAYRQLGKLDDAYHAYWEAKKHAEESHSPIRIAYAQLGLGEVQLLQADYALAFDSLSRAEKLFQGQNLTKPYLSALIALAKAALHTGRQDYAYQLLSQAELLAENIELTSEQIDLYQLLSDMYEAERDYEKSLTLLNKYFVLYQQFNISKISSTIAIENEKLASNKSRELAIKLAEKSELRADFSRKFQRQQKVIFVLVSLIVIMLFIFVWLWFKRRARQLNLAYDEVEKPAHHLASPTETKLFYQTAYKMARKYEYPLAIGYMSVENWKELSYRFNKKTINEVAKTIATLINEYVGEFDYAGLINEGEYLFLSPHQSNLDMQIILEKLAKALEVRFFANLGEFSVNIQYAFDTPSIQDIDPYIFLSRLSEAVKQKN